MIHPWTRIVRNIHLTLTVLYCTVLYTFSNTTAIPWLYSVGFSITFGTLFAKIRRVYVLFQSRVERRNTSVTLQETFGIIGGVLLLDVFVLTVWTIVDPLYWERNIVTTDQYGDALLSEGNCTSDHWIVFAATIALLHFGLLGVACYLCYMARDIPTKFSEGKYVTIAMISNLQIFVVGIPVLAIVGSDPQSSFFVRSVIIWMNDFVVITLIFGNLMYSFLQDRRNHVDSNDAIRNAMRKYNTRASNFETGSSQAPSSKLKHGSSRLAYMSESEVGEVSRHREPEQAKPKPVAKRERPPNSWAVMNLASSCNDDDGSDASDEGDTRPRDASDEGHTRPALEQNSEAAENISLAKATSREPQRKSLLEPSRLPTKVPTKAPNRFNYASSRIHRVRESHVPATDIGDDQFRDEEKA